MSNWTRSLSLTALSFLIYFYCASITFGKDYVARVASFQNNLHLVTMKLDEKTGKLVLDFDELTSCFGTNCQQAYNSVGSLARTLRNNEGTITDVALRFPVSGPPIETICCTKSKKKVVISRRCSAFTPPLVGTSAVEVNPIFNAIDPDIFYLKTTMSSGSLLLKLNANTCKPLGPRKKVISTQPAEFQISVQNNSGDATATIVYGPLEGFAMLFVKDEPGASVERIKLDVPNSSNMSIRAASHTTPQALLPQGVSATSTLLLYRVFKVQGASTQTAVFLQALQMVNGQLALVGKPKIIAPFTTNPQPGLHALQSVSLAPDGRFALYTVYSAECKKEIVKFQRLNPNTGSKMGAPQTLAGCSSFSNSITGAYGLDVIALPE